VPTSDRPNKKPGRKANRVLQHCSRHDRLPAAFYGLFRRNGLQGRRIAALVATGFAGCCCLVTTGFAAARLAARAGSRAAAGRSAACRCLFLQRNLGWRAFDHRLRAGTVDNRLRGKVRTSLGLFGPRRTRTILTLLAFLTRRTLLVGLTRLAILLFRLTLAAFTVLLARLALAIGLALLPFGLLVMTLLLDLLVLADGVLVAVIAVHIVVAIIGIAVLEIVAIVEIAAIIPLETFLHLRLGGRDDAVVMLGVLQIVFSYDTVTGALRITGERRIFLGNVLGGTANLYVRAGTVIGPGERVGTLPVMIVIVTTATVVVAAGIVVVTPTAALVLLSWPHRSLTWILFDIDDLVASRLARNSVSRIQDQADTRRDPTAS
jgi:hypothetical protein